MLQLHTLNWSNCFSYGDSNSISLDSERITQLVGDNGSGKTSIILILEELLFNKNSKGVKKSDIANRLLGNNYSISGTFSSGADLYEVDLKRSSSLKISLFKNGKDISSHTATGTFKTLEGIFGIDFKIFSQLIYQSNSTGLQFLSATDTNRKKFLIDLFGLENYLKYYEYFKAEYNSISREVTALEAEQDTIQRWIDKEKESIIIPDKLELIEPTDNEKLTELKITLRDLEQKNKKILDNEKLKEILNSIVFNKSLLSEKEVDVSSAQRELGRIENQLSSLDLKVPTEEPSEEDVILSKQQTVNTHSEEELVRDLKYKIRVTNSEILRIKELPAECSSCGQPVSDSYKVAQIDELQGKLDGYQDTLTTTSSYLEEKIELNSKITKAKHTVEEFNNRLKIVEDNLNKKQVLEIEKAEKETFIAEHLQRSKDIRVAKKSYEEWQNLYSRIDRELPTELYVVEELEARLELVQRQYEKQLEAWKSAVEHNKKVEVLTVKKSMQEQQQEDYLAQLEKVYSRLTNLQSKVSALDVLKTSFSTNGLVAYKLENLVKDLEEIANQYLADLSDGRFIIEFILEKDKLNVIIIDNGNEISINALSAGELARVNCATLLAIRKLMNSISKTQINILFLDEIINVLDTYGRESLVDILLRETDLNIILVSHGWSHPLLHKVQVHKDKGISRLIES